MKLEMNRESSLFAWPVDVAVCLEAWRYAEATVR